MWDLNRAERKAIGTALVLIGVSLVVRTGLAPKPGDFDGIEAIDPARDLDGVEGDVLAALVREQRAQTPLAEGERIDVNRASAEELRRLPGVGPSLAGALIEERNREPFRDAADLRRVAGVGEVTAGRLAPYLDFGAAAARPGLAPPALPPGLTSAPPPTPGGPGPSSGAGCPSDGSRIDLNRAGREALESLPGIGAVIAGRILEDRAANGAFPGVDALTRVRGIGERSLERLADRICAGQP